MDTQNPSTTQLQWEAPSFIHHERSLRWYVIALFFAITLACYGIWTENWTFVLAIILIGCAYFFSRKNAPKIHRIRLEDGGVNFDETFTSWKDCEDFWLTHFPSYSELYIRKKKGLNRELLIQTADTSVDLIRLTLAKYLPERSDSNERFIDALIRVLKL